MLQEKLVYLLRCWAIILHMPHSAQVALFSIVSSKVFLLQMGEFRHTFCDASLRFRHASDLTTLLFLLRSSRGGDLGLGAWDQACRLCWTGYLGRLTRRIATRYGICKSQLNDHARE